jgi:DNA polymerase III alpha subunit
MNWHQQIREETKRQKQPQKKRPGPTEVSGVCGIPTDATPEERFRLTVDLERVCERETKAGDPCYFLNCRDVEGMAISVVVWESQWSRFQGRLKEGITVTLDVRVPKEGYSAFGLVAVV